MDVLGDVVFVEQPFDDLDVGILGIFFAFAFVGGPGVPLGFGFELDCPGFGGGVVSHGALFVEAVEGQFLIVGDFLDVGLLAGVLYGFGCVFEG